VLIEVVLIEVVSRVLTQLARVLSVAGTQRVVYLVAATMIQMTHSAFSSGDCFLVVMEISFPTV